MIPLVCLDVDGTLVGSSGVVSDAVWSAADSARSRGQKLALCTARGAFGSSWEMAQRLDPDGWHVFHAGAAIVHARTAEAIGQIIDRRHVEQLMALAAERSWVTELYSADTYAVDSDDVRAIDHAALMGVPFERHDAALFAATNEIVRVQLVVATPETQAVTDAVEPTGLVATTATSPIMPGTTFVSVTRAGVTKATGISAIADRLGYTLSDVMMVGDGHNDIPALAAVGHPVAMGNAVAESKALARHHVATVADDGAAEALALSATLGDVG